MGKTSIQTSLPTLYLLSYTTSSGKSHLDVLAVFQGLDNKDHLNLRYDDLAIEKLKKANISKWDTQELDRVLKKDQILTLSDFVSFIKRKIPSLYEKKNIFIKIKAALSGAYYRYQDDFPKVSYLVSDHAPEYNHIALELQALCWVHDARYYKKLQPVLEIHKEKLADFINQYWEFYDQLLAYKKAPSLELANKIEICFDTLFTFKTDYFQLDKLIMKTLKKKLNYLLY